MNFIGKTLLFTILTVYGKCRLFMLDIYALVTLMKPLRKWITTDLKETMKEWFEVSSIGADLVSDAVRQWHDVTHPLVV